jgi:aspartate ammonia-lyase
MRKEIDFLGEKELPANVLFGIQSFRVEGNFHCDIRFSIEQYMAIAYVHGIYKRAIEPFLLKSSEDYL